MSKSLDKFLDIFKQEPLWLTAPAPTRREMKLTQFVSILPDGPLLRIEYKDAESESVVVDMTLTLEQVDYQIGELIKMRDILAAIKKESPNET